MSSSEITREFSPLPVALRNAGVIALAVSILAAVLLVHENVRSEVPPDFSRGGAFAGDLVNPGVRGDLSLSTPGPQASADSRSSAVLRAPSAATVDELVDGPPFPALGNYVYKIDGTESATVFGSRAYPPEMTMTVHRSNDPQSGELEKDELAFDLKFSDEHEEREIVAFRKKGISFTFEGGSVTFGPRTQTSDATYSPPMTQIPVPLIEDAKVKGTSRAIASDGTESRIEDWTVEVQGREKIEVMSSTVDAYVVQIERQSRPGTDEQVHRVRKYWLDPERSIWVKYEEHMTGSQGVGLGRFTYQTDYTAILDRIEPL
jgi:hypothetical protein